jgi:hypothetical protein
MTEQISNAENTTVFPLFRAGDVVGKKNYCTYASEKSEYGVVVSPMGRNYEGKVLYIVNRFDEDINRTVFQVFYEEDLYLL